MSPTRPHATRLPAFRLRIICDIQGDRMQPIRLSGSPSATNEDEAEEDSDRCRDPDGEREDASRIDSLLLGDRQLERPAHRHLMGLDIGDSDVQDEAAAVDRLGGPGQRQ